MPSAERPVSKWCALGHGDLARPWSMAFLVGWRTSPREGTRSPVRRRMRRLVNRTRWVRRACGSRHPLDPRRGRQGHTADSASATLNSLRHFLAPFLWDSDSVEKPAALPFAAPTLRRPELH